MPLETQFIASEQADSKHLMIVLHGLGDSIEGYRWLPGVMNLPWLNYLLVNAPDEYYGGFSWFPYPGEHAAAVKRSRELLFKLLDAQRDRGFATENTFMFGFSQGCLMAVEIGMRYPHQLAGIVGVSGWADNPVDLLDSQSAFAKEQRFLITHGTYDPLIPCDAAKAGFQALKEGGIQIEWHEFPKEHTIYGESEMSLIRDFVGKSAGR